MKKMKKLFLPLVLISAVMFTACDDKKEGDKKEGDKKETQSDDNAGMADKAAVEVCACMEELMNLQEVAKEAQEGEDPEAAMDVMAQLEGVQQEAMDCVGALQQKYDKVSGKDIEAAVKKACPKTAEAMFQ